MEIPRGLGGGDVVGACHRSLKGADKQEALGSAVPGTRYGKGQWELAKCFLRQETCSGFILIRYHALQCGEFPFLRWGIGCGAGAALKTRARNPVKGSLLCYGLSHCPSLERGGGGDREPTGVALVAGPF